jgi:methylated-DNA-[protein]-cysteine S-methyltransferase
MLEFADVSTPIGTFRMVYDGTDVRSVDLVERGVSRSEAPREARSHRPPYPVGSPPRQLQEYFRGERTTFELDPQPSTLSTFDRAVYRALMKVGAGETVTYGELARRAGRPGAARAVGGAMHRNPIPIVIPCHRVVGETQSLTGFGLGLWRKKWLLDHEGSWPLRSRTMEGPRDPAQTTFDEIALAESSGPRTRSRRAAAAPD